MDPYAMVVDRSPGSLCTQNFECRSKHCSKSDGVCTVLSSKDSSQSSPPLTTCQEHTDCNVNYYCAEAATVLKSAEYALVDLQKN